ncbi:MAG: hypothetical protein PHX83_08790 [Acidobacteriia bacterium]|nr:hypothetical protein [Terriglobia bacterium]
MSSEIISPFPIDWTPQLIRREPSDFELVLRDEVRELYAAIPEVRFVVVEQGGDRLSHCDVWVYFEMKGWDDELLEEIIYREFVLPSLGRDPLTQYQFHYTCFPPLHNFTSPQNSLTS